MTGVIGALVGGDGVASSALQRGGKKGRSWRKRPAPKHGVKDIAPAHLTAA